jgi:hypothetical protein
MCLKIDKIIFFLASILLFFRKAQKHKEFAKSKGIIPRKDILAEIMMSDPRMVDYILYIA